MDDKKKYESKNGLKDIDIIRDSGFECNGKVYFLEPHISPERFEKMQKFELELSFSVSFKQLYRKLTKLREELNKTNFVDSAVQLRDILEGIHRIDDENNHHPIMKYCACILNTDDEDRMAFDEKIMNDKIEDWREAKIPMQSFFALVLHSVSGLPQSYNELIRNILGQTGTTVEEKSEKEKN